MELREELQHTLGSTYTLERELQRGGMARVFVATETRLRRNVVVKVLSPELAADVSGERFEREIQLAASLQQANIVPVLSAGDMDGVPYYTMPFVEGESLRTLLATRGELSISETVSILRDVARALSYAHAHGVVHRDIKPDNVLLSHGAAVVTDFGIAKAISASRTAPGDPTLTQPGAPIGTPAYMAPEQVAGELDIDHRADVYAFGCLAYELLTGHPPFTDPSSQRVLVAHLTETPKPIPELRPETPPSLAALVMHCLEKHRRDRPASANEILQTLGAIGPSSGDGTSRVFRRVPSGRRLAFGSAVAILIVLLVAAAWWRGRGASGEHIDRSIVVLPLVNLSGDKANDYFGEGLSEEIANALGKAGLRVIASGTARSLVDQHLDPPAIARKLSVAYVLQGTVQQAGRLRITMSLTSASDSARVWGDQYDQDIKDVFAIQDEIARSVADQLRVRLAGGAATKLVRIETNLPEAHALYLQGLYQWNHRTALGLRQAISLFERAVRRDPNYARAYAGIAMTYMVLPLYDDVPTDSTLSKAIDAAHRALAIDNTLAEAYAVLGFADAETFKNAAAERSFANALRLDSSFATAHFWHALLLGHVGRDTEALREEQRARALDPASPKFRETVGGRLYMTRRFADADTAEAAFLAVEPTYTTVLLGRGLTLVELGRFDEAIATLEPLSHQTNLRSTEKLGSLAYAYARAGRATKARATLARLPRDTLVSVGGLVAAALDALGDRDSAVAMFRRAVAQHDPWILASGGRSAPYDGLRKDPRLAALFAKIEASQ